MVPIADCSTYANKSALWIGATKRRLGIDLGLQVGSVDTLFEFWHRAFEGEPLWD